MDETKRARLKELTTELGALLYEESDPEEVKTLAGIEKTLRGHWLEHVGPSLGHFLSAQAAAQREDASEESRASLDDSASAISKASG